MRHLLPLPSMDKLKTANTANRYAELAARAALTGGALVALYKALHSHESGLRMKEQDLIVPNLVTIRLPVPNEKRKDKSTSTKFAADGLLDTIGSHVERAVSGVGRTLLDTGVLTTRAITRALTPVVHNDPDPSKSLLDPRQPMSTFVPAALLAALSAAGGYKLLDWATPSWVTPEERRLRQLRRQFRRALETNSKTAAVDDSTESPADDADVDAAVEFIDSCYEQVKAAGGGVNALLNLGLAMLAAVPLHGAITSYQEERDNRTEMIKDYWKRLKGSAWPYVKAEPIDPDKSREPPVEVHNIAKLAGFFDRFLPNPQDILKEQLPSFLSSPEGQQLIQEQVPAFLKTPSGQQIVERLFGSSDLPQRIMRRVQNDNPLFAGAYGFTKWLSDLWQKARQAFGFTATDPLAASAESQAGNQAIARAMRRTTSLPGNSSPPAYASATPAQSKPVTNNRSTRLNMPLVPGGTSA